jgi:hypothetical protein
MSPSRGSPTTTPRATATRAGSRPTPRQPRGGLLLRVRQARQLHAREVHLLRHESNVLASGFSNYGESRNGTMDSFASYGSEGNEPENTFWSYGAGGNAGVDTFKEYRDGANIGDDRFASYAKGANCGAAELWGYSRSLNPGSTRFKGYGEGGQPHPPHRVQEVLWGEHHLQRVRQDQRRVQGLPPRQHIRRIVGRVNRRARDEVGG